MKKRGGLLQIEVTYSYKAEIINVAEYLNTKYKEDKFVNNAESHASNQPNMNSTIKIPAKVVEELNQLNENSETKKSIQHTKARLEESLKKHWESKVIHGRYIRSTDRRLISEEDTFLWLLRGDLKAEL
jgi:hypothetical protein